ncbi:MAG: polyphenol oxidase family protein [Candidatus Margulisiibacteriota bacterium]
MGFLTPPFQTINPSSGVVAAFSDRFSNLEDLQNHPAFNLKPMVKMDQVHGKTVVHVDTKPSLNESVLEKTDACFTALKGVVLTVKTADCLPILAYHPRGWIGAVHAGRKGTELGITKTFVKDLMQASSLASGFQFWLGPCICKSCYQIDADRDIHYGLLENNTEQILSSFAAPHHAEILNSNLCTACQNTRFFSYRKEATTERLYGSIMLK